MGAAKNGSENGTGARWRTPVFSLAAVFVVLLVFFYKPLLTGNTIFFGDFTYIFYPYHHTLAEALRSGVLPLWNPYNALGYPMVGDPQSHVLYPPAWIFALVPFGKSYLWFIFLHYFVAGAGMLLLLKKLGRSEPAALFGAFAFAFSGLLVSIHIYGHIYSISWMPFVFWSILLMRDKPGALNAGFAALFILLQITAGELQIVYFTAIWIGLYLMLCRRNEAGNKLKLRSVAGPVAAAVLAAAVAAPFIFSVARAMLSTARFGSVDYAFATQWSVHPASLYSMISINPYGLFDIDKYYWYDALFSNGEKQPSAASLYLGVSTLAFMLVALRRKSRGTAFFWVTAVVAALLAFGAFNPLYKSFFYLFPLMKRFNFPYKFLAFFVFSASVIASAGFDAFLSDVREKRLRGSYFLWLGAALGAIIFIGYACNVHLYNSLLDRMNAGRTGYIAAHLVSTVYISLAVAAVFVVLLYVTSRSPRVAWILAAFLAAELLFGSARTVWTMPEKDFTRPPAAVNFILTQDKSPKYEYRVNMHDVDSLLANVNGEGYDGLLRINRKKRDFLQPNFNEVFGLYSPWYYISYLPGEYKKMVDLFYYYDSATADLFNVRYITAPYSVNFQRAADSPPFPLIGRDPVNDIYVYRSNTSYPRAYWAPDAFYATGGNDAERLVKKNLDILLGRPVIEAVPPRSGTPAPMGTRGRAHIEDYSFNRVSIETDAQADGWLVLLDSYGEGWGAKVDGAPSEVCRANMFFRAVRVPAGLHKVEFTYMPEEFRLGLIITAAALALWAALCVVSLIGKRRHA